MDNNVADLHQDDAVWQQALQFVLDLEQTPDDTALIEKMIAWTSEDPRHLESYQQAERIWAMTAELQPSDQSAQALAEPADAAEYAEVLAFTPHDSGDDTEQSSQPISPVAIKAKDTQTTGLKRLFPAALAACLAVIVSALIFSGYEYSSGVGEQLNITLSDNSTAILSTQTHLDTAFSAEQRRVMMHSGEAFFRVSKDATRPFIVTTAWGEITVVGTRFNVKTAADQSLVVSVEEGIVEVKDPVSAQVQRLLAGEKLTITAAGMQPLQQVDVEQIARWRKNELIIDNRTIAELLAELERYHPGFTTVIGDDLADKRISGVFHLNDPLAAMTAAVTPLGGKVHALGPLTIISL